MAVIAQFEQVFASASVAMALLNASGRYVNVNDLFCRMLGRSRSDLLTKSWYDVTALDDIAEQEDRISQLIEQGTPLEMDKRYLRGDGSVIWAHVRASRVSGSHGGQQLTFMQAIDISERKSTENALRRSLTLEFEAARQLQEANRMKDQFVEMVAHDLKAPMSAIVMGLRGLERAWERLEDAQKLSTIRDISEIATNAHRLVDSVLDLAVVEHNKLTMQAVDFDLVDVVTSTIAEASLVHGGSRFHLTQDAYVPMARGDPVRYRQVVSNLLSNAARFSPGHRPVEVHVAWDGSDLTVSVRDYGIGINTDEIGVIFDRFGRGKDAGKLATGAGLGLYIARTIVTAQGGDITVESHAGHGTTFCFSVTPAQVHARSSRDR